MTTFESIRSNMDAKRTREKKEKNRMESMCHDESVIKTVGEMENLRLASIMTFISFGISRSKRIDLSASVSDAMRSESKRDTRKIIITYPFTILNKIIGRYLFGLHRIDSLEWQQNNKWRSVFIFINENLLEKFHRHVVEFHFHLFAVRLTGQEDRIKKWLFLGHSKC